MRLIAFALVAFLVSPVVSADLADCQNLYVGRVWVEKGKGLNAVVLLNQPGDGYGSYWIYFTDWTNDDKKAALAVLTAAKMSRHRVNVATTVALPHKCGIQDGGTIAESVTLATNP